jgi:hypothetical protein
MLVQMRKALGRINSNREEIIYTRTPRITSTLEGSLSKVQLEEL